MKNVTVIGAGTMGNGIAHLFAMHNFTVTLVDLSETSLEKAMATITKNLDRMVAKEKIDTAAKMATLNNITTHTSLENSGIEQADLVVEAATENPDIKLRIFTTLDKLCKPEAILASNTSSISITKIATATQRPEQVIGMHFFNPVPIMKLVEVVRGYATNDTTTNSIVELTKKLNKTPVEVNDYPGFISNRILMPMINESVYALFEGVAGVQEIDTVMKLGMAHPMGPLLLADFIGLDVCLFILRVLHDGLGNPKYAPCPLLVNMVTAGKLGCKSGEGFYKYNKDSKDVVVADAFTK